MKNILAGIASVLLLTAVTPLSAGDLWGGSFSKLNSRIIRSIAIAPHDQSMVMVGNKGPSAGAAQVFASSDGGVSWRFLNDGKPLTANATDVQAVAFVSPTVMLAGTWKHGLYRSDNTGAGFARVSNLPAKDIRSISVLGSGRILVATGANGIWKSDDAGLNWSATSQSSGFFWSLTSNDASSLLAASPGSGLYRSTDAGDSWTRINDTEGLYEATSTGNLIAAAGEKGLLISQDAGSTWSSVAGVEGVRLSSVQVDKNNGNTLLASSWTDGVIEYSVNDKSISRYVQGLPTLHVRQTDRGLLLGSWGKGLHVLPQSSRTDYLVAAARAADLSVVTTLLSEGAEADSFDKNRNTALIFAGRDGHIDIAKLLLRNGADVNWIDGEGVTALILAAFKNHPEMVRLLLDNGADKSVVDNFGRTAIQYAQRRGESDAIAKMLK